MARMLKHLWVRGEAAEGDGLATKIVLSDRDFGRIGFPFGLIAGGGTVVSGGIGRNRNQTATQARGSGRGGGPIPSAGTNQKVKQGSGWGGQSIQGW
jgi:hypothetical protein